MKEVHTKKKSLITMSAVMVSAALLFGAVPAMAAEPDMAAPNEAAVQGVTVPETDRIPFLHTHDRTGRTEIPVRD